MFVLHSDCYKLSRKCQCCCSVLEFNTANGSDSSNKDKPDASGQYHPQQVDNSSSIVITSSVNPEVANSMEEESLLSELPEPKKQRTVMMEDGHQEDAAAVFEDGVPSLDNNLLDDSCVVATTTAEPKDGHFLPTSSSGDNEDDEKIESYLREEKSPATMSADLLPIIFESSLVHNQSQIEAIVRSHTFIGSASRSYSKEDSSAVIDDAIVNVEYQGDNVIGCFDQNGNHVVGSSGHRRLNGPVYTVRKYKPSTDEEMVYAVIIWTDAAVKDKVEIEITSFDDYFELLNLS